ncbi:MAG: SpoIIE family protein phosphatase [Alphaproteobacteria bacterium]|nr:SpoIIE family protein phosphatase [Alphaproteobacteria bacterium]
MLSWWKKWFSRQSLTFRLSISILTSVFICGVGLLFFTSQYYLPQIRHRIDDFAHFKLQNEIKNITAVVNETQDAALTIKNTLKELNTTDIDLFRHLLQSALKTLNYDESDTSHAWIYVFPDGNVKSGILYSGEITDGDFIFKQKKIDDFYKIYPWFTKVPKKEEFFWSEPYVDNEMDSKPWVATNLLPFKFSGSDEYNGLVAVSMDLHELKSEINEQTSKKFGQSLLLSHEGLYVSHPDESIELKKTIYDLAKIYDLPELNVVGFKLKDGISGNIKMDKSSVYKKPVIFFFAPIPDLNWGMCLVFSQEEFFLPFKEFHIKAVGVMLAFLLILFIFISLICHRSTKPLLDLSKIALQYGKGDFSATIPDSKSDDEIGIMTDAFHKMRDNLLSHIEMVKTAAIDAQKNQSELEIAKDIQQSALPVNFPSHSVFEVYAFMKPARSVGGDFYDFFFIDEDKFAVLVADVSGKGIPAALYMMTAKALIKNTAKSGMKISKVFALVNNELCNGNLANMFVTAFLAVLNLKTGVLEYVNAGHNPPFVYDENGYRIMEVKRNMVLGGLENISYVSEQLQMQKGQRLFLYTDGVSEAQNNDGEFYGEERIGNILRQDMQSPRHTITLVQNDVSNFVAGAEQSDDITMLELLYCGVEDDLLVVKAEISSIGEVLKTVTRDMASKNIPAEGQSKITVACEEIFSNIAQYAYKDGGMVRIRSAIAYGKYLLRFIDNGIPYNPLEKEEPDIKGSADEREIGGLGIFMVKKMMHEVNYERVANQNILTIGIKL